MVLSGGWTVQTGVPKAVNGDVWSVVNDSAATATFALSVKPGRYEVFVYSFSTPTRAQSVPVAVSHSAGVAVVVVNQTQLPDGFRSVGIFDFATGTGSVTIRGDGSLLRATAQTVASVLSGVLIGAGSGMLIGCWLGVGAGFLPGWSMVHSTNDAFAPDAPAPMALVVPWGWIGALTLGLPLVTALVVGLAVRSRIPLNRRTD